MPRKDIKGPINDQTLNNTNHNFIELYTMRNVLQTQINDLVLESGDSNPEVVQSRGGHQVLADRLNSMDVDTNDLDIKKADKASLQNGLNSKRDKNTDIEMSDLSQSVREAFTGGSTPIVGKNSVGTENLRSESVTPEKLNKNYASQFPYYSTEDFDLDYFWENKTVIASAGVKNNPYGTGCEVIGFRGKTLETVSRVWVTQIAVSYGSGGDLGAAKIRHVIGDESTFAVIDKSEWVQLGVTSIERSMLEKNYAIGDSPHLSGDSFDLDYVWDQENYILSAGVKNNPYPTGGALTVNRFKTNKTANLTWITQLVVAYGSQFGGKFRGRHAVRVLAVNEATNEINYMSEWSDKRQEPIKILTIGNSFGLDTTKYIHRMAQSADINLITASLYISGGLLSDHDENITNNNNPYRIYNRNHIDGTITDNFVENQTVDNALDMHDWDYVFFNQASAQSGVYDSFQPHLTNLIDYVKDKHPNIKIVLMPTWAYSSDFDDSRFDKYNRDQLTMYSDILSAYKTAMNDIDFDAIVPAGTAIQNARTDDYMMEIGRELTRDGYHLSDTGCYIAGMSLYKTLVSKENVDFIPEGIDKRTAYFGRLAVNNAFLNPFKVTEI